MSDWGDIFDNAEAKEAKEFGPIPAGEYTGFILGAKINETKSPRVEIEWRIVDEGSAYANRHVFSSYNLNETGIPYLKMDLRTMGFEEITKKNLTEALEGLTGREAKIFVKPREYNGKTYYNVYINENLTNQKLNGSAPKVNEHEEIPF